jgi:hypothetical protein
MRVSTCGHSEGWVKDVDEQGPGWSGTQPRLFDVVAALVVPDRTMPAAHCARHHGVAIIEHLLADSLRATMASPVASRVTTGL